MRPAEVSVASSWVDTFINEAGELLGQIEESALLLGAEGSGEAIHQLFRAFHTIKGSGAMCGMARLSAFTHHVESALDKVRAGTVAVGPRLKDLVLAAADHIKILLLVEQGSAEAAVGSDERLIAALQAFAGPTVSVAPVAPAPTAVREERIFKIRFQPNAEHFRCGANPVLILDDLRKLGGCKIAMDATRVPSLDALQPTTCYLSWNITLTTRASREAVREVFLFVDEDEIEIQECTPLPALPPAPTTAHVDRALTKESTVRVPASRLDRLVNLVGELVMNQSRLTQVASRIAAAELANPVQEIERLVAELRDDVLGIRMLPIGSIFGRFRRLVHDLSGELGKEVDLVTEGADTELDKSVLDQLGEPLVHLVRNSLDHGIEPADERVAAGKPRRGTVRLVAAHAGAHVLIRIEDDGRGIDRAAVRAKAVAKKLISPDASVSDKELLGLILLPGFSTAHKVTSVSGRGVGMDVVKRQLDTLRGTLALGSEAGRGTTISLSLPLTLAIIEGLIVQVGPDQYILPMSAVTENVDLDREQRAKQNGRNLIAVREALIPYVDLREAFGVDGERPEIEKVVVVQHEDQRVGLVVDRVLGSHQTVLQSLGRFLRDVQVVSGATIMGDGRVALILDIAAVVRLANAQAQTIVQNAARAVREHREQP